MSTTNTKTGNIEESTIHPIYGTCLKKENYDYHLVIDNVPDPNNRFFKTIKVESTKKFINRFIKSLSSLKYKKAKKILKQRFHGTKRDGGEIEKEISRLINNQKDIMLQPTIGHVRDREDANIYSNVYFFENFKHKIDQFKKGNFKIYQDLIIGSNGNKRINYYICFRKGDKKRGKVYRQHKFSIKNAALPNGISVSEISEIEVFFINLNPKTSRGTVTTVTQPTKDPNTNL
ncbi:hypothetical protein KORDIASMS9_04214 [Kordia sp. SMS9]|uniref:hypothetical protein n=1 Tax=Kordia sp. SMS9 TaxID=2282170 RepID=UPI000E0D085A|nr:hypothetical protein [Kordia sp. SMS9]AXG71956.1 hypothetical protein KORDIASMS9_04214 [Kordia sp. SMS9]